MPAAAAAVGGNFTACASFELAARQGREGRPLPARIDSGDPAPDGAALWTRLVPKPASAGRRNGSRKRSRSLGPLAEDEKFSTGVPQRDGHASSELAHSVHVEVSGLEPVGPTGTA